MSQETEQKTEIKKPKEPFLLNIGLNVIIPSVILMKFSGPEKLGQVYGLVIAMLFPISYGVWDFIKSKKFNFFSGLGLFSVLMTGGIGLFKLTREWMIAKETAIPFLMGLAVIISNYTKVPLVKSFLNQILNLEEINKEFDKHGHGHLFEKNLRISSFLLGCTFFLSAVLNYVLAVMTLVGQPGTTEFNESLGKMTALSFPVITFPMMFMVMGIIFFIANSIKKNTEKEIENFLRQ
jgi:intracellular septation protein A